MEVTHKQLEKAVYRCHEKNIPLYVWGTTGIGKSLTIRKVAEQIAKEKKKELVDWNRIGDKEKLALYEDKAKREKSYVFGDMRLVDRDPSDLRGLPKLNGKDYVEWKPTLFFKVMSSDGVDGMIFFDEMNLAPPSVQGSAYQIVFDKCIGELALNPNIDIVGAGNRMEDRANVFEMGVPLKARFSHITLQVPTYQDFVDWGLENGVDDKILTFLQFRPSFLMADISKLRNSKSNAVNCPRTWKYASELIDGVKDLDDVEMYVSECVGDGVAIEFKAFLNLRKKIDLNEVLNNPESVKGLELDMKWSLISAVSEKYKGDKKILDKALKLCRFLEADFGASLLRMMRRLNLKHFTDNAPKCKEWDKVVETYGKYLM